MNLRFDTQSVQRSLLAIALLVIGGYAAWNLYFEHRRIENAESERLATQCRVIDENLVRQLTAVDNALVSIRDDLPFLFGRNDGLEHLNHQLHSLSAAMPGVRTLFVLNREGMAIASNRAGLIGLDLHEREYFKIARQSNDTNILHVSSPIRNALGTYAVNLERSISDESGAFAGLVAATLDPEYFTILLSSVNYAPDMWATLVHADGTLFIMVPEQSVQIGTNLAKIGTMLQRHLDSGQSSTILVGKLAANGEERLVARRTIHPASLPMDNALFVGVARDVNALYAPWWHEVLAQGIWFGLLTSISALALLLFQKRNREMARLAAVQERGRQDAEAALIESEQRWHFALEGAGDGVWDRNLETGRIYFSRRFNEMLGYSEGELGGSLEEWKNTIHPEDVEAVIAASNAHLEGKTPNYAVEYRVKCKDGGWKWVLSRGMVVRRAADGLPLRMIGTRSDISARKRLEEQLHQSEARFKELARTDPLTGLANRRTLAEAAETELQRCKRFGSAASLLMIDIDHFKQVNDTHGHEAGDAALVALAATLKRMARATDLPARYGGEEFVFLLTGTDLPGAVETAERIREMVSEISVASPAGAFGFTASLGAAAFAIDDKDWSEVLHRADQALYRAKNAGRNRVVAHEAGPIPP